MQNYPPAENNEEIDRPADLLSIGEAAEFLGVSIDTLRRWERRGKVKTHRSPGGHRYFSKEELRSLFGKRYKRQQIAAENPKKEDLAINTPLPAIPQTNEENTEKPVSYRTMTVDEFLSTDAKEETSLPENISHVHPSMNESHITPSSILDPLLETQEQTVSKDKLEDQASVGTDETDTTKLDQENKTILSPAEPSKGFDENAPGNTYDKKEDLPTDQTPVSVNAEQERKLLELEVYEPVNESLKQEAHIHPVKTSPLQHIMAEDLTKDAFTKLQQFIFGAFAAFLFADVILLIIWRLG